MHSEAYFISKLLHGVTILVPDGKIVGFIGKNGAGKTTTLAEEGTSPAPTETPVTEVQETAAPTDTAEADEEKAQETVTPEAEPSAETTAVPEEDDTGDETKTPVPDSTAEATPEETEDASETSDAQPQQSAQVMRAPASSLKEVTINAGEENEMIFRSNGQNAYKLYKYTGTGATLDIPAEITGSDGQTYPVTRISQQ